MKLNQETYELSESGKFGKIALAVGIVALVVSFLGYFVDKGQFFFSYLTAFMFWFSIALGALFLTLLHHATNAKWSIVIRRFTENTMTGLPLMILFFIPVAFGIHELYHWSHQDAVAHDALLQAKSGYLNQTFFLIRTAVYFLIWFLLCRTLYRTSLQQDQNPNPEQINKMRFISAPGLILFALTTTYASFDWVMSLDPHWYSTIFGLYIFAGSVVAILSFLTILVIFIHSKGLLKDTITEEHYHDLGKLLFGFVIFWAYMGFSQYFLQWYANIPEETIWYAHRWPGSWKIFSMIIIFGHFVVPFFLMMPRAAKRKTKPMLAMSIWLLLMHWVDLYWLIFPNFHKETAHLSWMDLTTLIGIGGIFIWFVWQKFEKYAVVPLNDPHLMTSIKFVNH